MILTITRLVQYRGFKSHQLPNTSQFAINKYMIIYEQIEDMKYI